MKLHALMVAAALAFAGTAFAQTYGTDKPAETSVAPSSTHSSKMHKKHAAKAKHHVKHHVSAMRHHREMHARAHLERHHLQARARMEHNTRALGAGPASPFTDLDSNARQHRMDLAYNDWLRLQQRRR